MSVWYGMCVHCVIVGGKKGKIGWGNTKAHCLVRKTGHTKTDDCDVTRKDKWLKCCGIGRIVCAFRQLLI